MSLLAEAAVPAGALAAIRAPFEAFGGEPVTPAVLQPLGLLLDLAGEAMRARLLVVECDGAEDMVLRPDFTIPAARAHLDGDAKAGRYRYEGKAFVAPYEPGRPAEFLQIGAEVFGPAEDAASEDASLAALAWASASAGGRSDLALVLGDVGLFRTFLQAIGAPEAAAKRLVRAFADGRTVQGELARLQAGESRPAAGSSRLARMLTDLPEAEAAAVLEELWGLAGIQPVGGRSAAEITHRLALRAETADAPQLSPAEVELIGRYLSISAPVRGALDAVEKLAYEAKVEFDVQLQPWVRRLKALVAAGVPESAMTLSTGFARPFGYYDGLLFEVTSAALGADCPVAAGGRYDGLLARLGAKDAGGAVGCMVRPARAWAGGVA